LRLWVWRVKSKKCRKKEEGKGGKEGSRQKHYLMMGMGRKITCNLKILGELMIN
jgi:hypothetical protein